MPQEVLCITLAALCLSSNFFATFTQTARSVKIPQSDSRNSQHVALLLRTYHGHARKFNQFLQDTSFKFLDREKFPITIILDDESAKDHEFGSFLSEYNYTVLYEPHPGENVLDTRPFSDYRPRGGIMHTVGYTRQLYSTFFFDNYTDADVIWIIDSDMCFQTVLREHFRR
jgi:hypothetical protein